MREIALALVASLGMVSLIEVVSGSLLARRPQQVGTKELTPLYPTEEDPDLGWVLQAEISHRAIKALDSGRICYDVEYHTDAERRRTILQPHDPGRPHLLLFGGSTTMGEGLPDEQTLQFFLGRSLPDHAVYNYAVHGYGPAHMLALLESGDLPEQVGSVTGRAIYVMIPEHVSRVTGDTRAFWTYPGPRYANSPDGVVRTGSFVNGRPYTTALYEAFLALKKHSKLLTLVNLELPPRISRGDVALAARVLIRSRDLYSDQFDGDFSVVLHPSWNREHPRSAEIHRWLGQHLSDAGVEVLDHSRQGPLRNDEKIDPECDQHPSGALNESLASAIARELQDQRRPG
jgi:hypothetical protein